MDKEIDFDGIKEVILKHRFGKGFFLSKEVYKGKFSREEFLVGIDKLIEKKELIKSGFYRGKCDYYSFTDLFGDIQMDKEVQKTTKKYLKYLKSKEWATKKSIIFAIKGNKCAVCGSTENIDVHHLTYERIFNEDIEDLEPVCRECHKKIHSGKLLFWVEY